jgi:[glutamine synthetase] adenylyltransferase / [glutamine synthetase]-adenylyl-L-tyrosine phosphorylase
LDSELPSNTGADPAEPARFSHYFRRLLERRPEWGAALAAEISTPFPRAAMASSLAGDFPDKDALHAALRVLRQRVMLRIIARDLTGLATLDEVVATVTALAETALRTALDHHTRWLNQTFGAPAGPNGEPQELIVIGMGKLGGAELNVSSDIDLVFAFPEDGETTGPRVVSNQEFFDKLGRHLIAAIGEPTDEGFVFRVDMRLRPYGEPGPLTCSFAFLEEYLLSQGREWERYAWLKARALTGSRSRDLEELVRPFVFRKYLDYDAYANMRELHKQIRAEVLRRDRYNDVKLGPGGIREIEFIAQVFQLIRGGRDRELQTRSTRQALRLLGEHGQLPPPVVAELQAAYEYLRRVEHRLQYRDDQQTQALPDSPVEQAALAQSMGVTDAATFVVVLEGHRRIVTEHFESIFADSGQGEADPVFDRIWREDAGAREAAHLLAEAGFDQPEKLVERLAQVREGRVLRQLPANSRTRFEALVPLCLRAASATANPGATAERMLGLLEVISRRSAYLALLLEHLPLLPRLAQIVGASAWAADYLCRHPILLDELLDSQLLFAPPDSNTWAEQLRRELDAVEADTERRMDVFRHFQHTQTFRLLAQDVTGQLTVERLADYLSALADLILNEALVECWREMPVRHVETPRFAVIAYGKLGGKELGYASDLDVVFLYDDPDEAAPERYARLAQRLIAWLTSMTGAGRIYEVDARLRPDGQSGLLVTSVAAFGRYQREKAWTWEHQALTRARYAAGDPAIGELFEVIRTAILRTPRHLPQLVADINAMRAKMHDGHPNRSALFDLKHDTGGMVDIEFIVQCLVLAHSRAHPDLTQNLGNIALLRMAGDLGLIPPDLAGLVADAYRTYRREQHRLRLDGNEHARVDPQTVAREREHVQALWALVLQPAGPATAAGRIDQPEPRISSQPLPATEKL